MDYYAQLATALFVAGLIATCSGPQLIVLALLVLMAQALTKR
jgi:hypothetical protein